MSIELIADLLAQADDLLVSDLDEASTRIRLELSPDRLPLLDVLEEHHRRRAREWARIALEAGVAIGRTLEGHRRHARVTDC